MTISISAGGPKPKNVTPSHWIVTLLASCVLQTWTPARSVQNGASMPSGGVSLGSAVFCGAESGGATNDSQPLVEIVYLVTASPNSENANGIVSSGLRPSSVSVIVTSLVPAEQMSVNASVPAACV